MLLALLFSLVAVAGSAQSRCETVHCMCELSRSPVPESQILEIRFGEGSDRLSETDLERLRGWAGPAVVISTTDGCGGSQYNIGLSTRRARAVSKHIPLSSIRPLGETTPDHNPTHRRTLVVSATSYLLQQLAANPADYYILDGSGSMQPHWREVRQFPFPAHARVYAAKTHDCYRGTAVSRFLPGGSTEIWYPLWKVIDMARPNTTVMVVSDLMSTLPLTAREVSTIEKLAQSKNIRIKYIKY